MYIASDGVYTAVITKDPMPWNPREEECLSTIVCWSKQHFVGDHCAYATENDFTCRMATRFLPDTDLIAAVRSNYFPWISLQENPNGVLIGPEAGAKYSGEHRIPGVFSLEQLRSVLSDLYPSQLIRLTAEKGNAVILPLSLSQSSVGSSVRVENFNGLSGSSGYAFMDKQMAMENLDVPTNKIHISKRMSSDFVLSRSAGMDGDAVMRSWGYEPVMPKDIVGEAEPNMLDNSWAEKGLLFKKDCRLVVFNHFNPDDTISCSTVASYRPDLALLTDENWRGYAEKVLKEEVFSYNQFLQGNCYRYELYRGTELMESLDGLYPDQNQSVQDMYRAYIVEHPTSPWYYLADQLKECAPGGHQYFDINAYLETNYPQTITKADASRVRKIFGELSKKPPLSERIANTENRIAGGNQTPAATKLER